MSLTAETIRQRFINLLKINEALTSETDFDALLNLIVSKSSELLKAERATLYLFDPATKELWSKIAQGHSEEVIRLSLGHGIAGYVAESGQPLILDDVYQDARFDPSNDLSSGFHTRNMVVMPLHDREGKLVGVLQVINKLVEEGPFDADDAELLHALSSTAAIALQNARLLEEVQEKERLNAELEIAADIQRNLLPLTMPLIEGIEMAAFCRPAKVMSGDYYNVMDFGDKVGLVVADVCGKSVPAAFLMALAHNTVRMSMQHSQQPREMLRQANRWLYNQMGDRYVAVTYMLLDLKKKRFLVSNAGQPTYPLLVRNGVCYPVEQGGLPLGLVEDVEYTQSTRSLNSGDLILIYTDGVVEAVNSARQEIFTFERLHRVASECTGLNPQEVIEKIVKAIDEFVYPGEQSDDITIMAFKII
ncbi:MAG TPA: GAF domain-containing SpoIIE family protein phosphatase [Chloroflexia bacterium]|nr:GAF domain-containing SpoIIE family protein phosphatase [Chloroflexia bacterium]